MNDKFEEYILADKKQVLEDTFIYNLKPSKLTKGTSFLPGQYVVNENQTPNSSADSSGQYYSLHVIQGEVLYPYLLKKCCKKYKKGKRCKKCPAN